MCNSYYKPKLIYESESCKMTKKEDRIQASEMKYLRTIMQGKKRDKIKNDEVGIGLEKLQDTLESNRIKLFGRAMLMCEHRLPENHRAENKGEG